MNAKTLDEPAAETQDEVAAKPTPLWRRKKAVALVLLVALIASAGAAYAWFASRDLPDGVAFRVSDRDVTADDVERYGRTMRALYGVEAPADPAQRDTFRRDLAKAYAVGLVVQDEAARRGVVIAEKTAGDALGRYVRDQFGEGPTARDRFVELLGAAGTTERAVRDEVKRQLALGRLFGQVTADVRVDDAEVRRAYDTRGDELGVPERRKLQNIVVGDERAAKAVLAEIESGAQFADVAARSSIDASTKDKGGSLGEVSAAQLDDAYAREAFAAGKGKVFGPVKTTHGWNVGKVVAIAPASKPAFDDIRDRLKEAVAVEKAIATWRDWLVERVRSANIRYADEFRPQDPDALPDAGAGMSPGKPGQVPPAPGGK